MSIRTIVLTDEQGVLLDEIMESGLYLDAAAALGEALKALRRLTPDSAALRIGLGDGVEALETAALSEADDADLDRFLDGWSRMAETER